MSRPPGLSNAEASEVDVRLWHHVHNRALAIFISDTISIQPLHVNKHCKLHAARVHLACRHCHQRQDQSYFGSWAINKESLGQHSWDQLLQGQAPTIWHWKPQHGARCLHEAQKGHDSLGKLWSRSESWHHHTQRVKHQDQYQKQEHKGITPHHLPDSREDITTQTTDVKNRSLKHQMRKRPWKVWFQVCVLHKYCQSIQCSRPIILKSFTNPIGELIMNLTFASKSWSKSHADQSFDLQMKLGLWVVHAEPLHGLLSSSASWIWSTSSWNSQATLGESVRLITSKCWNTTT